MFPIAHFPEVHFPGDHFPHEKIAARFIYSIHPGAQVYQNVSVLSGVPGVTVSGSNNILSKAPADISFTG